MEDIIDIIVTETTNLITITSSGSDEIIDVNIIDNREDIVLNVTPSVVEININSLTSNFGVSWGQITGTLSNQTDLNTALGLKADLVGGKVPSSQLPSYVDDVVEVANYAALPATGETGKIYITLDTNFMYRWSGSTYIEIKDSSAVWGAITGTLSSQTDLQSALNNKVPYTGATGAVDLGAYDLKVNELTIGKGTSGLSNNTALGHDALFHISTGNYNTGIGHEALHNTSTGAYNTAIGQSALFTNTTGGQNTAIGLNALLSNTSGGSNTALGLDSLQHNTTGSSNVALGYNAGSHITGGSTPNTTSGTSIYIGRDTRANANGGANEIVIGHATTGNGSNTVTIGNSSITANYLNGSVGIGSGSLTGRNLLVSANITGATLSVGVTSNGAIQSDVSNARAFSTGISVAASSTILGLYHYAATQGTLGAGATVDSQWGFFALNTLTGATNNYGFYGQLAAGTGRWNLYMAGTADNYLEGSLGIGATSLTGYNLRISKNITGASNSYGIFQDSTIQSDVTNAYINTSNPSIAPSSTVSSLFHYRAFLPSIGAGSTLTTQYGYSVQSSMVGATANYGFWGNLAAGTGLWNIYMAGSANNYLSGNLLIGSSTDNTYKLQVTGDVDIAKNDRANGAVLRLTNSFNGSGWIAGDIIGSLIFYSSDTSAAANRGAIRSISESGSTNSSATGLSFETYSSAVLSQKMFLTGAGNLLIGSTADNGAKLQVTGTATISSSLGIGNTSLANYNLRITKNITGATTSYAIRQDGIVQSDSINAAYGMRNDMNTAAASFTVAAYSHYYATEGTIGAGSAVTNQYGFTVTSSMTSATNNYGFFGAIAAGTNRWNLYMGGTAQNYLAGALSIGVTTANASALLQIDSTTKGFLPPRMTTTEKNAISTPATGLVVYDTTLNKLSVYTGASWETITSI